MVGCCLWLPLTIGICPAGLHPENVFLVVNARSWSSVTVANNYTRLRDIPASNVFALDWPGSVVEVNVNEFRDWILQPILREIRARKLDQQIRCIAYSTDFPYAIAFDADLNGPGNGLHVGSITGLTFHQDLVLSRSTNYTNVAGSLPSARVPPSPDSRDGLAPSAKPWPRHGLLSMMLGYTSGRGNSVDEVIRSLTRARFADGAFPRGTIYLMTNQDVRTLTRSGRFPLTRQLLQREHRNVEIADGICPQNRRDVLGLMMGFSWFDWRTSNSRLLPGSIAENLTSFGGILDELGKQTPISEFVRWGAAGTTGTVVEPYAIAAKFPDPLMHVYYVGGLTLVESIYASVVSPYQLLAIGDPLCRPWADQPPIDVAGMTDKQPVKRPGTVEFRPSVSDRVKLVHPRFDLYVDGLRIASCEPHQAFALHTDEIPAGYHTAVVTLEDEGNPKMTGRRVVPFVVESGGESLTATLAEEQTVLGQPTTVKYQAPGITEILTLHDRALIGRQIAGNDSNSHTLTVDSQNLGLGPVRLTILGLTKSGSTVTSPPLWLDVVAGSPLPAQLAPVGESPASMTLTRTKGLPQTFESTADAGWLKQAGVQDGEPFTIAARVLAETTGMHQVQSIFKGNLTVRVDDRMLWTQSHAGYMRREEPIYLEKGWHELFVSGRLDDTSLCELRFGCRGAARLSTIHP